MSDGHRQIYCIARSSFESFEPLYVEGPEGYSEEELRRICDRCIEQAGYDALEKAKLKRGHVGWPEIVDALVLVLKGWDFAPVEMTTVCYFGPGLVTPSFTERGSDTRQLLGGAYDKIVEYNTGKLKEAGIDVDKSETK